jgi:hypothetical protein
LFDKALIAEQHHLIRITLSNLLKSAAIVDIGRVDIPIDDQTEMIEHETEFAAKDPTPIGQSFLANLSLATPFSSRIEPFDAIGSIKPSREGLA